MSDSVRSGMALSDVFDGIYDGISSSVLTGYHQRRESAMPKKIPPLSDIQLKNAKPKAVDYKISDGGGMFLLVTSNGNEAPLIFEMMQ